jgi:hypothetical protein
VLDGNFADAAGGARLLDTRGGHVLVRLLTSLCILHGHYRCLHLGRDIGGKILFHGRKEVLGL